LCAPPPDEVSIADPTAISKIYDARGTFAKTDLYDVWEGKMSKRKNLFSERDEAVHAPRRRIVNQMYSMTNVLESERYVDQVTAIFLRRMDEFAAAHTEFNLCEWLERYTADVVGELMFGRPLGALDQSPSVQGYLSSRNALLQLISTMSAAPSYMRPFSFHWHYFRHSSVWDLQHFRISSNGPRMPWPRERMWLLGVPKYA
jgi:cytochrome P450